MNNTFGNLQKFWKNKKVFITGHTGFKGSWLVIFYNLLGAKVYGYSLKQNKISLYNITNLDKILTKSYIGDIRDPEAIGSAIRGVDFIFHAAALKQVPSCEFYPMEAIKTNVIGANNIISASINNNVNHLILLSTDKAVYPINAMGL